MISRICCALHHRLLLWRQRGRDWEVAGDLTWNQLGTYSGWMCAGCAAGALASALHMQSKLIYHHSRVPGIPRVQFYEDRVAYNRLTAAWHIFYPVQLLCTIFAMNMLLLRVSDHASHR